MTIAIPGLGEVSLEAEAAEVEGVYDITMQSGERYIGQGENAVSRSLSHFRSTGKFKFETLCI